MAPTTRTRTPNTPSVTVTKQPGGALPPVTKPAKRAKTAPAAKAKAAPPKAKSTAKANAVDIRQYFKKTASASSKVVPSALLDHQIYPHIFDSILQYALDDATHAFLRSLRAVSHSLRERSDLQLGSHLVLRTGDTHHKGAKWKKMAGYLPRGPPRAQPYHARISVTSPLGRLPGFVCDYGHVLGDNDTCGDDCTALRKRWEAAFASTTVLDHHPWRKEQLWRLENQFPALKVARKYPFTLSRLGLLAETVIVFTTLDNSGSTFWYENGPSPVCFIDETVRRMVIHTTFDCSRPVLPHCWVQLPPLEKVEDVVMILEPEEDTKVYTNPKWEDPEPQAVEYRPHGFLWQVFDIFRTGCLTQLPKVRFVIVGALELPPRLLGVNDDVERGPAELEAALLDKSFKWMRDTHKVQVKGGVSSEQEKEIRDLIRFVSVEQYRREVGEAQWALEAVRTSWY